VGGSSLRVDSPVLQGQEAAGGMLYGFERITEQGNEFSIGRANEA
jgi:hypothetical protein